LVEGCAELLALPELRQRWPQWRFVDTLPCLGVMISCDSGIKADLAAWRRSVIAAVLRNGGAIARRHLHDSQRDRLLCTVARPLLDFHAARWPVSPATAKFIDAVQRRAVLMVSSVPRREHEPIASWQRRRSRWAGGRARLQGLWSKRAHARAIAWFNYLRRPRNSGSLAAQALKWHDRAWRREQRLAAGSSRGEAGRLGTRVLTHVNLRWEDSLAF